MAPKPELFSGSELLGLRLGGRRQTKDDPLRLGVLAHDIPLAVELDRMLASTRSDEDMPVRKRLESQGA